MGKLILYDGGGKFEVQEVTTVVQLKAEKELQHDEVVYDAQSLNTLGPKDKLIPGKKYGRVPPNNLGL